MDAILITSPWRELIWIALGAAAIGLLVAALWLTHDALRPRRRRPTVSGATIVPPLPSAPDRTDVLEEIDGISARAAQVLREHGIFTYEQLAALRPAQLRFILLRYEDFRFHDPSTWPFQARLLAERRWSDFRRLTSALDGGVVRLRDVRGVGDCHRHVLEEGGIRTVGDLQRSSSEQIAMMFPAREREHIASVAVGWIDQARRLHEGDEQALAELAGIAWDGRTGGAARGFGVYEGRRSYRESGDRYGRRREREERYESFRERGSGTDVLGIPMALVLLLLLLLLLLIFGIGGCVATVATLSRVDGLIAAHRTDAAWHGHGGNALSNCWPWHYAVPAFPCPYSCPGGGASGGGTSNGTSSGGASGGTASGGTPPRCVPPAPPAPPPRACPEPEPVAACDGDGTICGCPLGEYMLEEY